jgi:hypothetical protein
MYIFQGLAHKNTRDSGDIIEDDGGVYARCGWWLGQATGVRDHSLKGREVEGSAERNYLIPTYLGQQCDGETRENQDPGRRNWRENSKGKKERKRG